MAVTFVTGNEKKWAEVQAILGDHIKVVRANIDGRGQSMMGFEGALIMRFV